MEISGDPNSRKWVVEVVAPARLLKDRGQKCEVVLFTLANVLEAPQVVEEIRGG